MMNHNNPRGPKVVNVDAFTLVAVILAVLFIPLILVGLFSH